MTAASKRAARSNVRELVPQSSNALFKTVSSMEDDIRAIGDFGHAIELMCASMEDEDDLAACALQRLAWEIKRRAEALEGIRGELFHALHPNRAHFERVGWPDGEQSTDGGRAA
ncbi:MAG: hypothetical protein ABSA90_12530 [Xanthobacteraceae bacterium]|jgi:hypothetical protein